MEDEKGIVEDSKTTSVLKAAWLIAVVTVVSKILGFVRDVVTAKYYGASIVSDAYFYAYQIPSFAIILLGGIGGPFHSATVAVFSKLIPDLKEKPSEFVNKLYNTFLVVSVLFFSLLGLTCFVFSKPIMYIIISNGTPQLIGLAAWHLRIMTPVFIVGGIVGIYYGLLITYKKFMLPNFSPMVMSLVIIIAVCAAKNDNSGLVLAWATTVGAICQFLLQFPQIHKIGFRFKPNFNFANNPEMKTIMELLVPAVFSSTIGQLHIYVDMFFTSSLHEGAWTALGYANRIFQFPVGILVTAFLVPLFPLFTRLVAKDDMESIRVYFNKGVGLLFYAAIPIIIGILSIGMDCVRVVFERGAFTYSDSIMVFDALLYLSFSIIPYVFRDSITRVYYAFDDSKTPFVIAASSIILKFVFNYLFITKLGWQIGGITLSTCLVMLYTAVALGLLISRKVKMAYKELFVNLLKMMFVGLITLVISYISAQVLGSVLSTYPQMMIELIKLVVISTEIMVLYVGFSLMLKVDYIDEVKNRLMAKIKRV